MFKRIIAAMLCSVIISSACCSCGAQKSVSTTGSPNNKAFDNTEASSNVSSDEVANFTAPEKGDKIVTINIKGYGAVKIRLFPEYAEKGVENFLGLAEKKYYDDVIFHRVIKDFMIQGGDPQGTGMGGECIWGSKFDGGTDPRLINCSGAVVYANSGSTATNGSQFYIVTGTKYDDAGLDEIAARYGKKFSDKAKEIYKTAGGAPWLDGGYTVFGQVIDGLDIVFKIQNVATNPNNGKPLENVVIESVTVSEYNGEELKWYMDDYK